jgi:hypothetical protein
MTIISQAIPFDKEKKYNYVMQRLIQAWAEWSPDRPPYILRDDEEVLSSPRSQAFTAPTYTRWEDVYSQPELGKPGDRKLQLGLMPHPFCGDMLNAEIYTLMLNPGYGPHNYFAELEVPVYREAVLKNLRQEFDHDSYPFYLLNPEFAWSGGYVWWHKKFAFIIDEISKKTGMNYSNTRKLLSQKIANIELVPYHSTSFYDPASWTKKLESAKLAREFVNEYVLPKVQRDEAILIVTRQVREWDLPEHRNITVYSNGEARSAHLSPSSRGGRAIIERLTTI